MRCAGCSKAGVRPADAGQHFVVNLVAHVLKRTNSPWRLAFSKINRPLLIKISCALAQLLPQKWNFAVCAVFLLISSLLLPTEATYTTPPLSSGPNFPYRYLTTRGPPSPHTDNVAEQKWNLQLSIHTDIFGRLSWSFNMKHLSISYIQSVPVSSYCTVWSVIQQYSSWAT
jgi:hypothetical protein